MPSWTPGSYLIRDFAANVEGLQARDLDGQPREVQKVAKNRWRIDAAGTDRLTVSYSVWAGELNVATSWVEADLALLNGAGIFLYSEVSRRQPQEVIVQAPPHGQRSIRHCLNPGNPGPTARWTTTNSSIARS